MLKRAITTAVTGIALLGTPLGGAPPVSATGPTKSTSVRVVPVGAIGSASSTSVRVVHIGAVRSIGSTLVQAPGDCAPYPASVVTVTDLRLEKDRVRRGGDNTAIITVSAQRGTPKGGVKVTVLPTDPGGDSARLFARLRGGRASADLPSDMRGRYGARAKYMPDSCSKFASSASGVTYYRVTRRG